MKFFHLLFFALIFIGNVAWNLSAFSVVLMFAVLLIQGKFSAIDFVVGVFICIASVVVWVLAIMVGMGYARRSSLRKCLSKLEKSGKYYYQIVTPGWLREITAERFKGKDRAREKASSIDSAFQTVGNFILLVPRPDATAERLKPPQAYPNHREDSLIFVPPTVVNHDLEAMQKFLIFHEIEHCTPEGLKREGLEISTIIYSILNVFVILFSANFAKSAVVACVCVMMFVVFEVVFFLPNQIEATTDLRALSLLNQTELNQVLLLLEHAYYEKGKKIFKIKNIRTRIFKEIEIRMRFGVIQSALYMSRIFNDKTGVGMYGLGTRSLFGAAMGIPVFVSLIVAYSGADKISYFSIPLYFIAFIVLGVLNAITNTTATDYWNAINKQLNFKNP